MSSAEYKDLKTQERTHAVENEDIKAEEKDLDLEIKSLSAKMSDYQSLSRRA